LFARATSIANPALWVDVWHEAPGDAAAMKAVFSEWIVGFNNRLDGQRTPVFWGVPALILLLYLPLSRLARRVLAAIRRSGSLAAFTKVLGAWWVALAIMVPALAMIFVIGLVLQTFGLANARLQPFVQACGEAVIRIAAAEIGTRLVCSGTSQLASA